MEMHILIQQDLAPAHTAKRNNTWFYDRELLCLTWPEPSWGVEEDEKRKTNNAEELKAAIEAAWASIASAEPQAGRRGDPC